VAEGKQKTFVFLTDQPLQFEFDPDTGILWVTAVAGVELLATKQQFQLPVQLGLTVETSRSLLAALPRLQSLLERALKGPTKPSSVQ
jgi:hypothetical protein